MYDDCPLCSIYYQKYVEDMDADEKVLWLRTELEFLLGRCKQARRAFEAGREGCEAGREVCVRRALGGAKGGLQCTVLQLLMVLTPPTHSPAATYGANPSNAQPCSYLWC